MKNSNNVLSFILNTPKPDFTELNRLSKIFEDSMKKTRAEDLQKIAQALGVSVEYLVCNPTNSESEILMLNKEQRNILNQYNSLNAFNKQTIQDLLKSLSLRQK